MANTTDPVALLKQIKHDIYMFKKEQKLLAKKLQQNISSLDMKDIIPIPLLNIYHMTIASSSDRFSSTIMAIEIDEINDILALIVLVLLNLINTYANNKVVFSHTLNAINDKELKDEKIIQEQNHLSTKVKNIPEIFQNSRNMNLSVIRND